MSKCLYENVLITMSFKRADTDSVTISSSLRERLCTALERLQGKVCPDVNYNDLLEIFHSGETHADLESMWKVRLSSIYGEFHNKENSPKA